MPYTHPDVNQGDDLTEAHWDTCGTQYAQALADAIAAESVTHDHIDEKTAGHGVVIDGLTIKDGYPRARLSATIAASDTLLASNDTQALFDPGTTYTIKKEIKIPTWVRSAGLRIKFSIKTANAAATAYAKIYKNGVAWGTEQSNATTSYVEKSEDLTGFGGGDVIQIWARMSVGGYGIYIQNFRVYGTITTEAGDEEDTWLVPLTGA